MKRSSLVLRHQSTRRRAAVAVMTAVTLVVLLAFASFAVDLGFVGAVCGDMQHTADGGALAGASALRESDGEDIVSARARAVEVIERMQKSQGFDAPRDQIVELGSWDFQNHKFTPADTSSGTKAYAVRVVSVRNKTPLFFAAIMGKFSTDVTREAVSLGSGKCAGIWGLNGVRAGSINTDSYDSTEGPYNPLTAGDNGDICSGRDITAGGSFVIEGDVMPGFGYGLTVNGSSGEITGLTTSNTGSMTGPTVDFGDVQFNNDNDTIPDSTPSVFKKSGWNLDLQGGQNLILAGGTYYFDSIKLAGGSSITIIGPTTIYVAGTLDAVGGTIVNTLHDPHDLTILSNGAEVKLSGSTDFYGSLIAPNAVVTLSSGVLYGAVIGRIVEMKGDYTVHVDESLAACDLIEPPMPTLVK